MKALLDGVPASDPVLLLAVVDGSFYSLPRDVRSWFGLGRENKFELEAPFKVSCILHLVVQGAERRS